MGCEFLICTLSNGSFLKLQFSCFFLHHHIWVDLDQISLLPNLSLPSHTEPQPELLKMTGAHMEILDSDLNTARVVLLGRRSKCIPHEMNM